MSDIDRIGLYHNLFLGCLVIFLICLAVAVVLFFVLDIKKVIGYLSGRTAKRQIEKLEEINESSGRLRKKNHSSMQKVDKKMNTERISAQPGDSLESGMEQTALLKNVDRAVRTFRIEREIIFIHTEEVI